jgi:pilus assembly protein CpaF
MIDGELRAHLRHRLLARATPADRQIVLELLHDTGATVGVDDVDELLMYLRDDTEALGPLTPLMLDPDITDVMVNAPDDVRIDRGRGIEATSLHFDDEAGVRRLAQRLAARAGRRLDDAAPWVDARLDNGTRLHAVLPPVSTAGTLISLRIPPRRALTISDLVARASIPPDAAVFLKRLVRGRHSFVVVGATGAGKTTVLSTLLSLVPQDERIVILEDSPELRPTHVHCVALSARPGNIEGVGEVRLRDLVRQSLRMRPDRIVLGEVRGDEIVDLLLAFTTGHRGGATTLHANCAQETPTRLEALALVAGMHPSAIREQIISAIDYVVDVSRVPSGRRINGIHRLIQTGSGVRTQPVVTFHSDGVDMHSPADPLLSD